MKMNCPWCKTKVEVAQATEDFVQLDTEMVKYDEMDYAVEYQLHRDGTATNLRSDPKKTDKFRVEHRWLCPDVITVSAAHMLPVRLRKVVEARAKERV